jgi:TetR/AcrR family transcriptional repressor of bet genes
MPEPRFRRYSSEVRAAMLVEAGLACLARGGITAFTTDNICREAGASRGLITHHFGSKEGLLAAVYAAAYQPLLDSLTPTDQAAPDLIQIIERVFGTYNFTRDSLSVWLALWGEVATNPTLQAEHRKHYARYRAALWLMPRIWRFRSSPLSTGFGWNRASTPNCFRLPARSPPVAGCWNRSLGP